MKKFVAFKKTNNSIKIVFYLIGVIILIILLNFILTFNNANILATYIISNNFGLKNNYLNNIFIKNIWGFDIKKIKEVNREVNEEEELVVKNKKPVIYLYNSYQTDKYKKNYYSSYSINPVVTTASLILKEYLESKGINTLVENRNIAVTLKENNNEYYEVYKASRVLMEEALKNNPSLKYFFDLKIMDNNYQNTTATYKDKKYAKVMFVIGTDNKSYQENYKLAKKLNSKLDKNLSRGIDMRGGEGYQGYYNEDFNSNTLLIEVGGYENTIDEVNRTLEILANVIVEVINEEEKK